MKNNSDILVKDSLTEIRFEWLGFDGDDCFNDFHINVTTATDTRRFDFGSCAVQGLRKLSKFFSDATQTTVRGGFRHPDVRLYDVHRSESGYCLVVSFEAGGMHEEFHVHGPSVHIDDEFLKAY